MQALHFGESVREPRLNVSGARRSGRAVDATAQYPYTSNIIPNKVVVFAPFANDTNKRVSSTGEFGTILRNDEFYRLSSPRTVWYSYLIETNNMMLYWLLTWFLHYIPGYFLDAVVTLLGVRPKGVPS